MRMENRDAITTHLGTFGIASGVLHACGAVAQPVGAVCAGAVGIGLAVVGARLARGSLSVAHVEVRRLWCRMASLLAVGLCVAGSSLCQIVRLRVLSMGGRECD